MELTILGAHNLESRDTRMVCLLVDGVLALDAGGLTSGLSFQEQDRVQAILLSHRHYDHIRDVPALAINFYFYRHRRRSLDVHAPDHVLEALTSHLTNGVLYPRFHQSPSAESPTLRLHPIPPLTPVQVLGYQVLAVPLSHAVPAVGYQVTSGDGKSFFYSGDAGPELPWEAVSPQLIVIELTLSDEYLEFALATGHLTPHLLARELERFRRLKGYLPPVVLVHMSPLLEDQIREEVAGVASELGADICLGYEGMKVCL